MAKAITSISVDPDLLKEAQLKGINVSSATEIGIRQLLKERYSAEDKLDAERKRIADATVSVTDIKRRDIIDSIKRNMAFNKPLSPFMQNVYQDILNKPENADIKCDVKELEAVAKAELEKEVL